MFRRVHLKITGIATLGVFGAVFVALVFCSVLRLAVPAAWNSQATECGSSLDDHQDMMSALIGPAEQGAGLVALAATAIVVAFVLPSAALEAFPATQYVRLHPQRRDRLLESFSRGILHPKIYPSFS